MDGRAKRLAEADRHIAQSEGHVAHQERIVADLRADGHSTVQAEALLRTMQETLQRLRELRALIEREPGL